MRIMEVPRNIIMQTFDSYYRPFYFSQGLLVVMFAGKERESNGYLTKTIKLITCMSNLKRRFIVALI